MGYPQGQTHQQPVFFYKRNDKMVFLLLNMRKLTAYHNICAINHSWVPLLDVTWSGLQGLDSILNGPVNF